MAPWFLQKIFDKYLQQNRLVLVDYKFPEKILLFDIFSKTDLAVSNISINEASQIYTSVKATSKICGDIAEVGVYRGSTAKIICEANNGRAVHLFDTFEGLPEPSKDNDEGIFQKSQYTCTLDNVKKRLSSYPNVSFYKGLFPSTGVAVKDSQFSFVHLDVDLYDSTKDSLAFFYPRMTKGGIIISHDYFYSKGVRKAFDEFFENKTEPIIKLVDSQCMIVKC